MKKNNLTIEEALKNKVEIEKFKFLIKDMHRGFPNFEYRGMVEKVIITEKMREELEKSGFLIKEGVINKEGKLQNLYMLGPPAINLVSSWKTEELTQQVKKITIIATIIAGIALLINLISLFKT